MTGAPGYSPSQATPISWRATPACAADDNPERWHPIGAREETIALRELKPICTACPVRAQCLTLAIANKEEGIWAGTTTIQRKQMRRRPRKAAA